MIVTSLILASFIAAVFVAYFMTRGHVRPDTGKRDLLIFVKVLGLYIAIGRFLGNCFSPAIAITFVGRILPYRPCVGMRERLSKQIGLVREVAERKLNDPKDSCHRLFFPAFATIVFRFRRAETTIHLRLWGTNWNSEHLARRFGNASEQDFGTTYFWKPPSAVRWVIGSHMRV